MKVPNLRTLSVSPDSAKDADSTDLNNAVAHETADTVTDNNQTIEYFEKGGNPSGPFGNMNKPGD